MVIRVEQGKGQKDGYVMLSPTLLETYKQQDRGRASLCNTAPFYVPELWIIESQASHGARERKATFIKVSPGAHMKSSSSRQYDMWTVSTGRKNAVASTRAITASSGQDPEAHFKRGTLQPR
jgi:hypothetical protein